MSSSSGRRRSSSATSDGSKKQRRHRSSSKGSSRRVSSACTGARELAERDAASQSDSRHAVRRWVVDVLTRPDISSVAQRIASFAAHMDSVHIPMFLLQELCDDEGAAYRTVRMLIDLNVLHDDGAGMVGMRAPVQDALRSDARHRHQIPNTMQLSSVIVNFAAAMRLFKYHVPCTWPTGRALAPHALRLLQLAADTGVESRICVMLARGLAEAVEFGAGNPGEAISHHERYAEMAMAEFGVSSLEYGVALHALGQCLAVAGIYETAYRVFQRAVAVKSVANADSVSYATSLIGRARCERRLGQWGASVLTYQAALDVINACVGQQHSSFITVADELASIMRQMKEPKMALALAQSAVRSGEETLGKSHPRMASLVANLAKSYTANGNGRKARKSQQRARQISKASGTLITSQPFVLAQHIVGG